MSIVAGFIHLLLHLGLVGGWRALRRQTDRATLWIPACHSMRWRQSIMYWAIRLPQRFLGSFALQGASSSVLKPHLDRKREKKKGFRFQSGQINKTFWSVNYFRGKQAPVDLGENRCDSCQLSEFVVQSICHLKQDADKNSLCHL